jgi:hypothetical protein
MDIDKLKDILRFFAFHRTHRPLGRVKLVKLVFLADYMSRLERGEILTGLGYHMDSMGPHSWEIPNVAGSHALPEVREATRTTVHGHLAYDYVYIGEAPPQLSNLSVAEAALLNRVWAEWGEEDVDTLLDYVHGLPFVAQFRCGETIDWDLLVTEEDVVMTSERQARAAQRIAQLRAGARERAACVPFEASDSQELAQHRLGAGLSLPSIMKTHGDYLARAGKPVDETD